MNLSTGSWPTILLVNPSANILSIGIQTMHVDKLSSGVCLARADLLIKRMQTGDEEPAGPIPLQPSKISCQCSTLGLLRPGDTGGVGRAPMQQDTRSRKKTRTVRAQSRSLSSVLFVNSVRFTTKMLPESPPLSTFRPSWDSMGGTALIEYSCMTEEC